MTPEVISDVCGTIPYNEIQKLFETTRFARTEGILKLADEFLLNGYDLRQLLVQLNDYAIKKNDLNDLEKSSICEIILKSEISLLEGTSPNLKLYSLLTEIRKIFAMS